MSATLANAIFDEATKLVTRHQSYACHLAETMARMTRRGQKAPGKQIKTPDYWITDDGFNPYRVRPRSEKVAYAIGRSLRRRLYEPRPAVTYTVPKSSGGKRDVCVFQIADNAVSRLVYKSLLAKNARQFSARCYAYRDDLSVHDAVAHIAAEFREHPRLFVAEFDFSKYFDSIAHEHLRRLLADRRFYVTRREQEIVEAFMTAPTAPVSGYPMAAVKRERGVPQGTSISLFLANLAAFPLDRRLERIGVGFARYADDTVIWSHDYSKLCDAVDALNEASLEMGVGLNLSKSDGVSMLTPEAKQAEFRPKATVDFVGYRLGRGATGIRDKNVRRAIKRLSQIIYTNLLEAPLSGIVMHSRLANPVDADYITMIYQARRYLYGGVTEEKLAAYLSQAVPVMHYKGFMSFYPLVDDEKQLKQLDGWLFHTIWTSLRRRRQLLIALGVAKLPQPFGLSEAELIDFQGKTAKGKPIDLTLPSFFRIARMFRKATLQFGPNAISHPQSNKYYLG